MTEHIPGWDEMRYATLEDCGVQVSCAPGPIVALCEQGTDEWLSLRKGRITASKIGTIVGLKGERSKAATADSYKWQLVAERITGVMADNYVSPAMQRGSDLEPEARRWYAQRYRPVQEVGFIWHDAATHDMGASPDGICADRGLEIKCLTPDNHCRTLARIAKANDPAAAIDRKHRLQMQFAMWCSWLPRWDYCLYSPPILRLPCKVVTVEADHDLFEAFDKHLPEFAAEVAAEADAIRRQGDE